MRELLLVGTGGFVGSVLRYAMQGAVYRIVSRPWIPWGTLAVNVLGCLVIGMLSGLADAREVFGPASRLFLFIGVLGGFTTFSTFGYETFALARDGQMFPALANVLLQVSLGLLAVWIGYAVGRLL